MAVSVNDKLVTVSGLKAGCDSKLNTKMNNASGQLPITNGGTGATTAAAALAALNGVATIQQTLTSVQKTQVQQNIGVEIATLEEAKTFLGID